jgi:hypothetical protein
LFYPLASMSFPQAAALWLGIRVIVLLFLFQIWRGLLPAIPVFFLALAAAFGFNGSVIWDLRTGNVTVLQDLLLWLGFAAYVQGRHALSAVGILVGSLFKLVPAAFLGLLLVRTGRRGSSGRVVLVAAVCLASLVFLPTLVVPWSPHFLRGLAFKGPWGMANPSALNLINMLSISSTGAPLEESSNVHVWLYYAATILVLSVPAIRRAWISMEPSLWVYTLTPLFVLLNPRPVAYGYFLAIPAMFAVVSQALGRWRFQLIALIVSAQGIVGAFVQYRDPWTTNLAFIVLVGLWTLYAIWCARERAKRLSPSPTPSGHAAKSVRKGRPAHGSSPC